MNKKQITVVGSYLVALVMDSHRIPLKGETLLATNFRTTHGGKGSNQAVQAARLGADVSFVGRIGNDAFGKDFLQLLHDENINGEHVFISDHLPTGAGFIICAADGHNLITIDIAAIREFDEKDVDMAMKIIGANHIVMAQCEIPLEIALYALKIAKQQGAFTILNPAPAYDLSGMNLNYIDVLTPNETEARVCLGLPPDDSSPDKEIAVRLLQTGCKNIIVTLGDQGSIWATDQGVRHLPPFYIEKVVDSTGAGDAFNAGLATALAEGKPMPEAIHFANATGALSVTKANTIPSFHHRQDVDEFMAAAVLID